MRRVQVMAGPSPRNPPDDGLLPLSENPTIDNSMRAFLEDGYPHLNDFLKELATYKSTLPIEVNVLIFNVFGSFFLNLKHNMLEHDLNIEIAMATALNSVAGDPVVAAHVQRFMESGVAEMVRRTMDE